MIKSFIWAKSMNKENNFSFDELFENEGNNCEFEERGLFEYLEQQLPEKDRIRFEQHLVSCTSCSTKLAELQEIETAGLETQLDSAISENILSQNRAKIQIYLDQKYPSTKARRVQSESVLSRLFRAFTLPGYANAMVVALLLVLLYPAYKSMDLNREVGRLQSELNVEKEKKAISPQHLSVDIEAYEKQIRDLQNQQRALLEPSVSPSAVYSARPERAGETDTIDVHFSEKEKSFSLLFTLPPSYDSYMVQILQNEKPIWQNEFRPGTSTDSAPALISVNLQAGFFQEGSYHLQLLGMSKTGRTALATYRLKVRHS